MPVHTTDFTTALPSLGEQFDRLVALGVTTPDQRPDLPDDGGPTDLLVPASAHGTIRALVPLITHRDKSGFIVEDMTDIEEFTPTPEAPRPEAGWYVLADVQRGDEFSNASPEEALAEITASGRTPLTMSDGVTWLLQQPDALERNHCFMTIGSRKRKGSGGYDSRTPALWISNGTGRDGVERKNAPKLGWCWWRNRHTWLGIAHAAGIRPLDGWL